jgi:hypothetical protein
MNTSIACKSGTGNPATAHNQRVLPPEANLDPPTDVKATSRADSFEQFSSEDEAHRPTPKDRSPTPTPSPPVLHPIPVPTETGPWTSHHSSEPIPDGAQPMLAWNGSSLSARSSFQGFSEEDEGAPERDAEQRIVEPGLPEPKTEGYSTPDGISAQGSFQTFSDEETDGIQQPIPGDQGRSNQLPDNSTYDSVGPLEGSAGWKSRPPAAHNSEPALPDVPFAAVRPESSTSVSGEGPLPDKGDPLAATQMGWDSSDIATTSKLKHGAFIERNRRVKFGGERPFTPQHRPFPPRTPMSATSRETPFPSLRFLTTEPQQPTWHADPRISSPGPSRFTEYGSKPDEEMIDVNSVATHFSPIIPSSAGRSERDEEMIGVDSVAAYSSPTIPSSAGRFTGMKDKVTGSLENTFSRGTGCNQSNRDYLSQDETSLVSSRYQVQQT